MSFHWTGPSCACVVCRYTTTAPPAHGLSSYRVSIGGVSLSPPSTRFIIICIIYILYYTFHTHTAHISDRRPVSERSYSSYRKYLTARTRRHTLDHDRSPRRGRARHRVLRTTASVRAPWDARTDTDAPNILAALERTSERKISVSCVRRPAQLAWRFGGVYIGWIDECRVFSVVLVCVCGILAPSCRIREKKTSWPRRRVTLFIFMINFSFDISLYNIIFIILSFSSTHQHTLARRRSRLAASF